ncbi:MAG TPA: DUF2227 family putative metal-binding protein [Anaerolineales bacterium]|nr:DUF2227 family putative metal-binding protein [Anaerolineales bacterium]
MPSGKIHALATTITAGVGGPMMVVLGGQPVLHGMAFVAGCMTGLLVNPDLDMRHDTRSHTLVRRSAGFVWGALWRYYWTPYSRLIPYHRHWLSHTPVLGTLLRLLYLFAIPGLIYWALTYFLPIPAFTFPQVRAVLIWSVAGLMIVDGLHAVMDRTIH